MPTLASPLARRRPSSPPRRPSLQLADASDERLLAAVRQGDDAAYAELYHRHHAAVRRYARSLVPAHEVDDLTSEAFARTLQALRRSKGPADQPIRYLLVAARTGASSQWARGRRQEEIRDRVTAGLPTAAETPAEPDELLLDAFADLAPRSRQALWWNVVEGIPPHEIAERLGSNPAAVSALLYRAKRSLREAYAARGGVAPRTFG